MKPNALRWVATCARGLEEILESELAALALAPSGRDVGGVRFAGPPEAAMRANWRLRSANRVLLELAAWPAADDDALYRGAHALLSRGHEAPDLSPSSLLTPERTFAIHATSSRSRIRDTRWIALKVKDGIVDAQRQRYGRRSSIARQAPDLALRLRLAHDRAHLLLDTSGEPLDRRGYRLETTTAPVREQLAAAALLASGWNGCGPVVDPMCGSGTFVAEAGAMALGLAPNRLRPDWPFLRLPGFSPERFAEIRREPIPAPDPGVRLYGSDIDPGAVEAARRNLDAAGLAPHVELRVADAFSLAAPAPRGLIVLNPPYGERLSDSPDMWRRLGDLLKQRYRGWNAVLLAGDTRLGKELGLRPRRRLPAWNGPLETRILLLDLY